MTTLNFNKEITLGVMRAEVTGNKKYCAVQNCGVLPQSVFNLMHKNHDNGGISANFLVFEHGMKEYEVVFGLENVIRLIEKNY